MALDLGELYAKITIKDDGVTTTLDRVKDGLDDVKTSADKVENINVKTKADTSGTDKAKRATEDLGKASERTSRQTEKIKFPKDFTPDAERAKKSVENVGDGIASAAAKFTKFTAAAAGTAVVGTIGTSLYKGFQRLDSIDQATAKLEALGNSGTAVESIMDNALASVKGTAFGLGEAATVSAQMVASGVKPGQELEKVLGTVADTAAIAGSSMEDMGLIFGSVAARGKLQGDDLMQMLGRGIPVLQILAEQLGVTSAEVSDMVSNSEIDFQTFADAMEGYVGGGAKRMGDTVSGAMKNLGASFSRVGESIGKGAFAEAPAVIGEITGQVDTLAGVVGPMAQEWSARLTPAISEAATSVIPMATAALGMLSDGLELSLPLLQGLTKAITSVPTPVLAAGLLTLTARNKGWTESLDTSVKSLRNWVGYAKSADGAGGKMAAAFRSSATPLMVLGRETRSSAKELTGMAKVAGTAKGSMQTFGGTISGVANGAMSGFKSGASGIISMLGGPWGLAIMGATTVLGILVSKHLEAKKAEQEHEQQQRDLASTMDTTTGAITEQTNALVEKRLEESGAASAATELGLAQSTVREAVMGNADAMREVEGATNHALNAALEGSKIYQSMAGDMQSAGISADDVRAALMGNADAMEKINQSSWGRWQGNQGLWNALASEMEETTGSAITLGEQVGVLSDQMESAKAEGLKRAIAEAGNVSENTRAAFGLLGDSITSVPDEKTIVVDSMAPAVQKQLEDLRATVERDPITGEVRVTFPEGMNIMAVLDEIGAKAKAMPDGRVDLSDNTPEVQERLKELGLATEIDGKLMLTDNLSEVMGKHMELEAVVEDPMTGELHVNDNVSFVKTALDELGMATQSLPAGEVKILDDTAEVRAALTQLGIETVTLPDGHVAITDTTPENLQALAELGITTENLPPGHVAITDTSDENMRRLNDLGVTTTTLPNGKVVVTDNANETARNIKSILSPEKINTVSEHVVNITRRITDIFTRGDANGGMYDGAQRAVTFADGGTTRALDHAMGAPRKEPAHLATITPPGTYRVHGESETGGEAYIPLSTTKRDRSTRILSQVATQFGYNLVTNEGEAVAFADGAVVPGSAVVQALKYMDGTPYIFGGFSPAGVDCSGAVSLGVNKVLGLDEWDSRTATAGQGSWLSQKGFKRGRGTIGDVRVAFLNGGPGGGHTAMQLDDGTYIESGGNTGGGFTIGGKAGPLEGRGFTDFYYLPGANPLDAEAGLDYFNQLGGAAGSRRHGNGTDDVHREINGGAGPLIRDGSVLELVAALYSKQTGEPMDDDIVSWGQAIGLYSELSDQSEKTSRKEADKLAKSIESTADKLNDKRDSLPIAEEDLRIAKMKRDETHAKEGVTDSQKASADQKVAKAEQKVKKLKDEITELERELAEQENALNRMDADMLVPVETARKSQGTSGNKYADAIIREGRSRGVTDTGIKIALATALVESGMKMYANPADPASMQMAHDAVGYDHDSVGLFQQRNNGAWGTTADRMDAAKSAGMFYDELVKADYNTGDAGAHAQRVQKSAFPSRYAERMGEAQGYLDKYNSSAGLRVTPMANGGILDNARSASINEGSAVLWAEDGPEAYIPLSSNKRAQSLEIWAETGKRLGVDVMSMLNMMGAALPGLLQGQLNFSTGASTSINALGVNEDAASYRAKRAGHDAVQNAVGAVFNGPVQINDPKNYLQGQLDTAGKQLGNAMRSVMLK
ncbi:tape measure protein [Corynebacterium coyleae]|uniref:tape measure protein n=1 Tax=Corynebacterium coyleae TaxID=53374 RepID=UPI00254AD675|nr:tape measure protein [Corynebacterium coyleae]MDK8242110.1 tape measure protein [Corynebacterium coyleae]